MPGVYPSPHERCRSRLAEHLETVRRRSRHLTRLVRIKRFVTYTTIGYVVFDDSAAMLLVPTAILLVPAAIVQNWIGSRLHRAQLVVEFYRDAVARIEDRWIGRGESGARFLASDHVFAGDLDLFGEGSLFQFLCAARTSIGKETLAAWLMHPGKTAEILDRQAAVRELAECLDVRERLAVVEPNPRTFRPAAVAEWERAADPLGRPIDRFASIVLLAAAAVAAVVRATTGEGMWLVVVLFLECAFYLRCRRRLKPICATGYHALKTQAFLSEVRAALRGITFKSRRLSEIQSAIGAGGLRPVSVAYALYGFAVQLPLVLLPVCQMMPRIDRWRRNTAARTQAGLSAMGELEALISLSQHAFEQPDAIFPTLVDSATCYEATELGHPLIPRDRRVKNGLHLNDSLRLLLVSGSNMSGKSTMLRTVGINAVLALCGGAVCARQFRISPFSIGTAMRFEDSLLQKTSHFYAVISRVHAVMQLLAADRPLLFLFDEILQGTNSRDRFIGAEAVVRKLVDRGGVGLVTTHDLELTRLVDGLQPIAANVHFVDQMIDGEIHFDYRMRPGVVQTTNALALMRRMGLEV